MRSIFTHLAMILLFLSAAKAGHAQTLQIGISNDVVPVASDFDGTEIVLFGSIEGAEQAPLYRGDYHVVIKVQGADEDVVVRRKERIGGIWVNNRAQEYAEIPSFYSIVSPIPLNEVASNEVLDEIGLGISEISASREVQGEFVRLPVIGEFGEALKRIRADDELFVENGEGLEQLSPTLFRAKLWLPPNVPIGEHRVTAFLFKDKQLLTTNNQVRFRIEKVGFERWIYNLAHEYSLLYGFLAVFVAIFTGWSANAIFRKN